MRTNTSPRPRWAGFKTALSMLVLVVFASPPLWGDVSFVHQFASDELLLGTKQAELTVSYGPAAMFVEKETRFTGSWMKRFFGQVKEERVATHFLLDRDQIREIDWQNRRIFVFDLEKMDSIQWIKQRREAYDAIGEHLKSRYDVKAPQLSITLAPDRQTVGGHPCSRVTARLRLETVDLRKRASSITIVDQELWLSEQVPGYAAYHGFHTRLARRLGIEAHRLGPLTYLLRYWNGSLAPINDTLNRVQGYPVKSTLTVTARYVTLIDTDSPRTLEKRLKQEAVALSSICQAPIDLAGFTEPGHFEIIHPR